MKILHLLLMIASGVILFLSMHVSYGFSNGQDASLVLGQDNFTTFARDRCTGMDPTASTICIPTSLAFDHSGNLWVADSKYYRILEFSQPLSNYSSASMVIGQNDFATKHAQKISAGSLRPGHITFDKFGNLWEGDDDRILEFTKPFTNGQNASLVIGQPNFTSYAADYGGKLCPGFIPKIPVPVSPICPTRQSLYQPSSLEFDSLGNLWVADFWNNRVLEFKPPFANWMNASLVIGQTNFTSRNCSNSMSSICHPQGLAFDSAGNLWVSDPGHARIVKFAKPFVNGETPTFSIGDSNETIPSPAPSSYSFGRLHFSGPSRIFFDPSGNLWVSDSSNNRLLEFVPPFTQGMSASLVIGQKDFKSYMPNNGDPFSPPTAASLNSPAGIAFDPAGDLFVADAMNDRVLEYANIPAPEFPYVVPILLIGFASLIVFYRTRFAQ